MGVAENLSDESDVISVMRRFLAALLTASVLGSLFVLGTAGPSYACSCVGGTDDPNYDAASLEAADVVFIGTAAQGVRVRGIDRVFDPWRFDVESVQKGPDEEQFVIHTESAELTFTRRNGFIVATSSCGFRPEAGHKYQIYADRTPGGGLTTGSCSANRDLATAKPYRPPTSAAPAVVATAIALAALALAAIWEHRRGRA